MSDSTFPVVYMVRGGVRFNCLHGYSRKMDTSRIRDSITPLSSGREIGIAIETFSASIESIAYEVLTLDGMTSLEHTQVIKTEQDDEYVRATLKLQNQMLMNQRKNRCRIRMKGKTKRRIPVRAKIMPSAMRSEKHKEEEVNEGDEVLELDSR